MQTPSSTAHTSLLLALTAGALLAFGLVTGCDTTVRPVVENGRYYSVAGLLDAAADTQWVRVEHLRDSVAVGAPEELDATVQITHLESGTTTRLRDSLVRLTSAFYPVHVFWADFQPTPGDRYALRVEGPDGATTGTTRVPTQPPTLRAPETAAPGCTPDGRAGDVGDRRFDVRVTGVETMVGVGARYVAFGQTYSFSHADSTERTGETQFRSTVVYEDDLESIGGGCGGCPCPGNLRGPEVQVIAATATEDGPPILSTSTYPDGFERPRDYSNVSGGVGFFGGIYSDTARVSLAGD
jgi:hypothetical protein